MGGGQELATALGCKAKTFPKGLLFRIQKMMEQFGNFTAH
jgi:hypothetical protein